ncbi:MAG: amidase [Bryobacterales bacterium]|nr:amidase [Bryobacterales bacterium]
MTAVSAGAAAAGTDPADFTIEQAMELMRKKKLTPAELVGACLKRIEKHNPELKAFITVTGDEALKQARALKPADAAGAPLHGIPVALKDLYDTAGVKTTCASRLYEDRVPAADATSVKALKAAGAIVIGKANMDEFAYNFTGETSAYGTCLNPWNTAYSPGGSSGGSGVAVATGMCLGALGSDTGGSIRLPASVCGITGYKPTFGLISTEGVAPLAWSLDHVGPMTRTARDAAIMHAAMAGSVGRAPAVKSLRVGIPEHPFQDGMDTEVGKALSAAVEVLKRLTAGAKTVGFPRSEVTDEAGLPKPYGVVIFAEAYAFHREMVKTKAELYHPQILGTIKMGENITAADYIAARREMERLRAGAAKALFADCDVLITPTSPKAPFRLGSNPSLVNLRNTAYFNMYGLPTISVPCGLTGNGMPIGVQITGAPKRDEVVFAMAEAFQGATEFHRRRWEEA